MLCDRCYQPLSEGEHGLFLCPLESRTVAPAVIQDSIEGGLDIHHGLCNEDGTPRTYYSQSEIDLECQKRGLVRWTDCHTEDKTKDARVRMDWLQSSEAKKQKAERDEMRRAGVWRPGSDWKRIAPKRGSEASRAQIRQAVIERLRAHS